MSPHRLLMALLALAPVLAALPAPAAEGDEGKLLYRVHCQACHGETGRGDGPMRDQLEMSIPDLTTLAKQNQGQFPTEKVHWTIDGRHETAAHGTREMPVWGFTFQAAGRDSDQEVEIQGRITALTRYVATLQVGVPEADPTDDPGD